MQIIKLLLKKADDSKQDAFLSLPDYGLKKKDQWKLGLAKTTKTR